MERKTLRHFAVDIYQSICAYQCVSSPLFLSRDGQELGQDQPRLYKLVERPAIVGMGEAEAACLKNKNRERCPTEEASA